MKPQRLLTFVALLVTAALVAPGPIQAAVPSGFEHFHTYAQVKAVIDDTVAVHETIAQRFSLGQSYEGREIWGIKISDNVALDEDEPEVFFNAQVHARERLGGEMALYIIEMLTGGYGSNQRITDIVNSREIWIVPTVNPDGAEFDISGGVFHQWRKNRQPLEGTDKIGVDLNRQFGFKWACCGGSSANPGSDTYHGPSEWFAPEVVAYRDFVDSRVVDGRQQIKAIISWHTAGEMVLWPYAYTRADVPSTMAIDDWRTFVALGNQMASLNGYKPQQGSDLYIVDGDQDDWAYYEHRIFTYTFEMAKGAAKRYYPTAAETASELARNREAVLLFLEQADCPYRAAGLGATHCGPLNDDFETGRGWSFNGTPGSGGFERADPAPSRAGTRLKQRGKTTSGEAALVTGAAAGADANANDVDGVTSALSPQINLGSGNWSLRFRYTFAHDALATTADGLRVFVVRNGVRTRIWKINGRATERNARWSTKTLSLSAFAGQTIRLEFEVRDGAADNVVEAALDDVRVYATP